ncbi:MAG: SurA N-terminal domain-containing protein, partial [Saprospiraceae bacterium]|nr:SurA N-terminal domain-containing protein [Saprospiraceae bacterium]
MALISKIRKQSGLLITLIALALVSFVVMDMTSSRLGNMGKSDSVGSINGQKVDYREFQKVENILYGNDKGDPFARRSALWNYFVDEALLSEEAEDLGLGVGKDELNELQFGANLSPIIQQRFSDPNTRQVDRNRLAQFKQAIDGNKLPEDVKPYWAHQQKEIITDRIQSKLSALVAKALYTPTWQAEMLYNDQNSQTAFNYVRIPFDKVQDAEVKLEDSDYKAYLDENKALYKQDEETRKIGFVAIDVKPTVADSIKTAEELAKLIAGLRTTDNDSLYAVNNYGNYDGLFHKKDELPPIVKDTAFDFGVGAIYGPFLDGEDYRVMKVVDKRVVADSVKSRHILIKTDPNNPASIATAEKTIDSLKTLIETGVARFDSLAMKFGQDGTNAKGGDLGYTQLNGMVKPFNDLIFFKAEKGKLYKVTTQFGVHLVEMLDK